LPGLRFLLILGALIGMAPMSIDMYLPSLPTIQSEFAAPPGAVQFTLAAFFVGLAVGQLAYGPVSDRLGRKPPLSVGTSLYVIASVGCALAPSLGALVAFRLLQALGSCAALVISRAMVRDLLDPRAAARAFSTLLLVMGVAPILAPLGGSLVLAALGWRPIFWILVGFGLVCLALIAVGLPETRPRGGTGEALESPARAYARLLGDGRFLGYALAGGVAQAGMFAYIAGSPSVFIETYGVRPAAYGWIFGANAVGLIAASQVNRRLLHSFGPDQVLGCANLFTAVLGLVLVGAAVTGAGGLAGVLAPIFGFVASLGFTQPNAVACALAAQGARAGSASALLGSLQFLVATVAASLVGLLQDGTARPMAAVMAGCALLAFAVHWLLVRRRPHP
jgi:MFS transporter, DHA1 family, multidrug resistance protein